MSWHTGDDYPPVYVNVLARFTNGSIGIAHRGTGRWKKDHWYSDRRQVRDEDVIKWHPLPKETE